MSTRTRRAAIVRATEAAGRAGVDTVDALTAWYGVTVDAAGTVNLAALAAPFDGHLPACTRSRPTLVRRRVSRRAHIHMPYPR